MTNWKRYKRLRDRLTGKQEIQNILEIVQNYPRNVSKKFRNINNSELEISLYISNFVRDVTQLTDCQTYQKFRINRNRHANIPEMSPNNFRKISHPEVEISLYLSNLVIQGIYRIRMQFPTLLDQFYVCDKVCLLAYFLTEIGPI